MVWSVHPSAQKLRLAYENDGMIEFEGEILQMESWEHLKPGDVYIAGRNGEITLATFKSFRGYLVIADDYNIYPYDRDECYKVTLL